MRLEEADGDSLTATAYDEGLVIETYEKWAGDTFSGFGGGAAFTLTHEQARELAAWLLAHADGVDAHGKGGT